MEPILGVVFIIFLFLCISFILAICLNDKTHDISIKTKLFSIEIKLHK